MLSLPYKSVCKGLGVVCVGALLSSCAAISVPTAPAFDGIELDSQIYPESNPDEFTRDDPQTPNWWTRFDDPDLISIVDLALSKNRDLSAARANLLAADAVLNRAILGGSVGTSTSAGLSLDNPNRSSDIDLNLSGGLGASWEYDAFGSIDAQIRAAALNREAAAQLRRDVAVLIASQTAQAFIDMRSARQRLTVAEENAALQAEGLDLVTQLVEAGRSNDLDLSRSRTLYLSTRASLPIFRASVATAKARLKALTGAYADSGETAQLLDTLSQDGLIPQHLGALAIGSPTDLIRRRPDIRAAEARIGEQFALGDVDRARLFPTLTFNADLSGFFGSFNSLTQSDSFGFGIGPALQWEGPDLRRVRADIDITDAQTLAAIAAYESTVFAALSDVEAALALYRNETQRRNDLENATQAARNSLTLARLRFEEGLDDFLDVLDAQRTLLDAQDDRVQNETLVATYAISAYRALGGMWTTEELDTLTLPLKMPVSDDGSSVESPTP